MNYLKSCLSLLLILICFAVYVPVSAQSIPQNLSNTNVDNLTDAQINALMQKAQASGLSDNQLLQQAQSNGMSADQVQRLRNRIAIIRKNGGNNSNDTTTNQNQSRQLNYHPDSLNNKNQTTRSKIFGADLFRNSNTTFEPNLNLATPVNYVVGPADQLNISIYGNSLANWQLKVSPDGNINIPGIGLLNVAGKTIENATSLIKSKLTANNYAIGKGTNVQVTLGNIRSIKVIMIGQLQRPGTYTLSSLATVFNALYAAGGPTENGSLRQIEVIRNNRIISHLDVYDFLVKGSQKDNIALRDQDIVRVPSYRTRVEMAGEVKIPALFEVIPGETLQNIIDYAGGFTDSAYTARIKVSQIKDQQRTLTDVVEADYKDYIPLRGDKYTVESVINRFENRVIIKGAVFRPGEYELQKGLTLAQLIKNAAGVKEDAFMDRGTITRLKPDNNRELISFNLKDVINNVVTVPLQREDSVNISSIFDLRDKYIITINGSVRKTGDFAYADSMKVEDLIIKAGGFAEGASPKRIEVARRIYNADPQSKSSKIANVFSVDVDSQLKLDNINFVLKPYDIVSVYSLPGFQTQSTVKVEGEVLYPGNYTIQKKNEKISDLIARAGGLTASADVEGGTLKRNNITILGGGDKKSKIDTAALQQDRLDRLRRLKKTAKDSTSLRDEQRRNDYVGIDLKKILNNPGSSIDLIVEDQDVIRVPKQQQIVRVNGEVLYPSAVVYNSGKSFNDYVLNAGGFSVDALKRRAYIVYANGTVKGTRKIFFFNSHPSVKPGSEIYVPKKPPHVGNTVQELLGVATGIASMGAIILGIISVTK